KSFSMAVGMILVVVPIQIIAGDQHGLNTLEHQPAKIAAIEGLWETEKGGTSLNLVGWPDMQEWRNPWPEGVRVRGPPRFDDRVLELSHHGRHGPAYAPARRARTGTSLTQ